MGKIISIEEFKKRKRGRELRLIINNTIKEADAAIEETLKRGMCECCSNTVGDLKLLRGMWRCFACLGV